MTIIILMMQDFNTRSGWLTVATLIICSQILFAQQQVSVDLTNSKVNEGWFHVEVIRQDTTYRITSIPLHAAKQFYCTKLKKNDFLVGDVAKWSLISADSTTMMYSYFCLDRGKITIYPESKIYELHPTHALQRYQSILNNFKGEVAQEELMIDELLKNLNTPIYSNYVDFILARAYDFNPNLFTDEDINSIMVSDSRWFRGITAAQESSTTTSKNQEQKINSYETVVLKFWASWCGPCLRDEATLKNMKESGGLEIPIISIQTDSKETITSSTLNIIDDQRYFQKAYSVQSLPTYIYLEKGEEIFKTSNLKELLDHIQR